MYPLKPALAGKIVKVIIHPNSVIESNLSFLLPSNIKLVKFIITTKI